MEQADLKLMKCVGCFRSFGAHSPISPRMQGPGLRDQGLKCQVPSGQVLPLPTSTNWKEYLLPFDPFRSMLRPQRKSPIQHPRQITIGRKRPQGTQGPRTERTHGLTREPRGRGDMVDDTRLSPRSSTSLEACASSLGCLLIINYSLHTGR